MYGLTENDIIYIKNFYKKASSLKSLTIAFIISLIVTGLMIIMYIISGMFFQNTNYAVRDMFENCSDILVLLDIVFAITPMIGRANLTEDAKKFFIFLDNLTCKQNLYLADDVARLTNKIKYSMSTEVPKLNPKSNTKNAINRLIVDSFSLSKDCMELCEILTNDNIKSEKRFGLIELAIIPCVFVLAYSSSFLFFEIKKFKDNYNDTVAKIEQVCNKNNTCKVLASNESIKLSSEYGNIEMRFNNTDNIVEDIDYKFKVDVNSSSDEMLKTISEKLNKLNSIITDSNIQTEPTELVDNHHVSEIFVRDFKNIKSHEVFHNFSTNTCGISIHATYEKEYDKESGKNIEYINFAYETSTNPIGSMGASVWGDERES